MDRNGKIKAMAGVGLALVLSCSAPLAAEPSSGSTHSIRNGSGANYPYLYGIMEQAEAQIGKVWMPPADAVLIQGKELVWPRLLETALKLPAWMDLGIENRTRFEVYDHPWRTSQTIGGGRTDPQIVLRSRVRLGLGQGPVRLLFEGQDARSYMNNDSGDFRDTTTVNEWDILQAMGSLTVGNLLGSGLRTDLHVGRMTLDFGSRRFIARNDFRNTTNAFDGVHWQIVRGPNRFRAFLTEPVIRDDVQLDEQHEKFVFWGTYAESLQFPWLFMNVYYFGLNDKMAANVNNHRTLSTYGLRLYKLPEIGQLDYEVESAWQTGTRGTQDHFAHFQHAGLGYTFDIPWSPRLLLHYDYASGDSDPNNHQSGRDDLSICRQERSARFSGPTSVLPDGESLPFPHLDGEFN